MLSSKKITFPFFIYPSYFNGTISQTKRVYGGRLSKVVDDQYIGELLILGKAFAEKNNYPTIDEKTAPSASESMDLTIKYVFNKGLLYLDSAFNEAFNPEEDDGAEEISINFDDDFPAEIEKGFLVRTILIGHQPPHKKPPLTIKWRPSKGVRSISFSKDLLAEFY